MNWNLPVNRKCFFWIPGESSLLQSPKIGMRTMAYTDNADNLVQTFESGLMYDFTFKSGFRGVAMLNHQYENVTDTFNLSDDVYIPSGKYGFNRFETHLNSPQSNQFILGVDFTGGSFYDGSRLSFGVEPLWNIGSTLQLGLKYEYNIECRLVKPGL